MAPLRQSEDSFEVGFYVALAAVVVISVAVILWCICCKDRDTKRLIREKEDLQKNYETFKMQKENVEADCDELRRKTKWKTMTEACVNVTLDPDTASPSLRVSEYGSQVRFTGERSAEWPSVLGREGFTSGMHYWEVEVGEKGYWVLGVSTHPHEKSIPEKPGEGYWLVRLAQGKICTAVSQSGDQILKLEKICKVWGVYLDHEGGRLSFYNAETRFHIHTLEGSFPGQVYPIFSPGSHDKGPLIINATVKNV
ncbi:erythroid membrane-associated protein-like isoform X2 [Acipenser ruthenus]|uniref:erythroid membrane-associated protein-like isoform X2 n=1 Tax=Acipenser ruthenus TaxID=7906 RepID=UPI002741EBF3|nr:erythroid membrane-associated protein-like isoform X2 [Acipenser ruthenus]